MADFDRLAKPYATLERLAFLGSLQSARIHCLPHCGGCERGLLIGDGDGRFSSALLAYNQRIEIDSIDISSRMLELAKRRAAANNSRLKVLNRDARSFLYPRNRYDFVGLHFALDCFGQESATELISKIEASLKKGAIVAYSDFQSPRAWHRFVVASLYWFFRIATQLKTNSLPTIEWSDACELVERKEFLNGLVFTEVRRIR